MLTTFEDVNRHARRRSDREELLENLDRILSQSLEEFEDEQKQLGLQEKTNETMKNNEKIENQARKIWILVAFTVGLLASVVALSVGLAKQLSTSAREANELSEQYEVDIERRYNRLHAMILKFGTTSPDALVAYGSPQARALSWLAFDDAQSQYVDVIRIRFALATLFFSTNDAISGDERKIWRIRSHWLSDFSVCSWYGDSLPFGIK